MMDGCCYHVAAIMLAAELLLWARQAQGIRPALPLDAPPCEELERLEETGVGIPCRRALSWKTLNGARSNQFNESGAVGRPVASRHDSITERIADRGDIPDDINVFRMPTMTSTRCTNL